MNLASYNYLGFADNKGPCADAVEQATRQYGLVSPSSRAEAGSTHWLTELERLTARYTGKEDAMVVSMGFATNSTTIPALVDKVGIQKHRCTYSRIHTHTQVTGLFGHF